MAENTEDWLLFQILQVFSWTSFSFKVANPKSRMTDSTRGEWRFEWSIEAREYVLRQAGMTNLLLGCWISRRGVRSFSRVLPRQVRIFDTCSEIYACPSCAPTDRRHPKIGSSPSCVPPKSKAARSRRAWHICFALRRRQVLWYRASGAREVSARYASCPSLEKRGSRMPLTAERVARKCKGKTREENERLGKWSNWKVTEARRHICTQRRYRRAGCPASTARVSCFSHRANPPPLRFPFRPVSCLFLPPPYTPALERACRKSSPAPPPCPSPLSPSFNVIPPSPLFYDLLSLLFTVLSSALSFLRFLLVSLLGFFPPSLPFDRLSVSSKVLWLNITLLSLSFVPFLPFFALL